MKNLFRIFLFVFVFIQILGICCLNSIMFHPQRASYDKTHAHYVNIGTNGENYSAIVYEPTNSMRALIRCYGNAEDAACALGYLADLASEGITVAAVDYPGYGFSAGSPDEEGCYRAVHRLYDWLVEVRGFNPTNIIVSGFSIGTGPAVELAATHPVGGLVLEASYLSAPRIVTQVRLLFSDPFPNLKRIKAVKCPIIFFHGTDDCIIPYKHGQALYDLANEPKRFISVEGAGHNNIARTYGFNAYLRILRDFCFDKSCPSEE